MNEALPLLGPLINAQTKRQPWVSTVYLYETTDGTLRRTLRGFPSVATHLVFRPDGRRLLVGGGHTELRTKMWMEEPRAWGDVAIWSLREPEPRTSRLLEGHTAAIRQVTIDDSGRFLASASYPSMGRTKWNPSSPSCSRSRFTIAIDFS